MGMSTTKKWYAIYTKPRWEKKVHRLLQEQQVECYCPLNKVHRKWSDRIKTVHEPLFKSYVFVRISEADKTRVRMINGVVNFVYWLGKPAIIKDREIETIKRFLDEHDNVEVRPKDMKPGAKVMVQRGILMGKKGTIKQVLNNRVEVIIESIGFTLTAYLEKSKISTLDK
jgi:transcription antitermination factor NusG